MSDAELACHGCGFEAKLDAVLDELKSINRAFPDGPESHRIAHESMIAASKAEERFWNEMKLDLAKKGVWGLLIIILGFAVMGIAAKFGLGVVK